MHRPAAPQGAVAVSAPEPEPGAPIRIENAVPVGPQAEPARPPAGNADALLRVNSVERDPDGAVRIHFDTVEEHAVTGRPSDPRIRRMLLYAVQCPLNPGIRLDSLDLLGDQTQDKQVLQVLIRVLLHDPNPGVRLKALESLTPQMNRNAAVRQAIVHTVLHDANVGVRSQAVSALSQAPPHQAAPLLLQAGDQTGDFYLRLRIAAALRQMQASVPPRWLDARANPAVTSR